MFTTELVDVVPGTPGTTSVLFPLWHRQGSTSAAPENGRAVHDCVPPPATQPGTCLRDAGGRKRLLLKAVEDGLDGVPEGALNLLARRRVRVLWRILLQRRQNLAQVLHRLAEGTIRSRSRLAHQLRGRRSAALADTWGNTGAANFELCHANLLLMHTSCSWSASTWPWRERLLNRSTCKRLAAFVCPDSHTATTFHLGQQVEPGAGPLAPLDGSFAACG